ncbi:putative phage abortive infection protein [Pedobacter gandavensis]|uniref:putative phage abortive infection protein n=1 Tax=Pedobacter gandavensis TaxID=2679963 RepID=UPI0029313D24|nr:putative phage abortive infection protein [Pedobacter gandavensis]
MTAFFLIMVAFAIIIFLVALAWLVRLGFSRFFSNTTGHSTLTQLNWQTVYAVIIAFILIGLSLLAPFLFTREAVNEDFNFMVTGQIGDTIGGIMNPFVALAGVIVTGLAFYMQYRANLLQRQLFNIQLKKDKKRFEKEIRQSKKQFKKQFLSQNKENDLQQFHAQFYEMLRLHKENVNEMELPAKRSSVQNIDMSLVYRFEPYTITKRAVFVEMVNEFEQILKAVKESDLRVLNNETFKEGYKMFFWGCGNDYGTEEERSLVELFEDDNSLKGLLSKWQNYQFETNSEMNSKLDFDILAFRGHSGFLGHYFRHLFLTVKFVVNQKVTLVSYKEKMGYLQVLRAQLSNHEQILLFYNWLGGYGEPWEGSQNRFFTEYKMIHNLWYENLINEPFLKSKVVELAGKSVELRKGPMFEIGDPLE